MAKNRITRRQKNISRLLREKKEIYPERLKNRKDRPVKKSFKKIASR